MTHIFCLSCRLRFSAAAAAHLDACPACGELPQRRRAEDALGFRLVAVAGITDSLLAAEAVALPVHDPDLSQC